MAEVTLGMSGGVEDRDMGALNLLTGAGDSLEMQT